MLIDWITALIAAILLLFAPASTNGPVASSARMQASPTPTATVAPPVQPSPPSPPVRATPTPVWPPVNTHCLPPLNYASPARLTCQ